MNVRQLSRAELNQAMQELRNHRIDLAPAIDHDQALFRALPGDTFGDMCESAERMAAREKRMTDLWHGGQAITTLSGGYLILSALSLWHNGAAAVPMLIQDPGLSCLVGGALLAAGYVCRQRVNEGRAREENLVESCDRMYRWQATLQGAEAAAAERNLQDRKAVERLAEGLKDARSCIHLDQRHVRVGGVQVKRRA